MENCKGTIVNHYYCCCKCDTHENSETNVNYSFEEEFTGKIWVDGKKIYQKTIDLGYLPNNDLKEVNHGIANIDYVIGYEGNAVGNDSIGKVMLPLPLPHPMEGYDVTLSCRENNFRIFTKTDNWKQIKGYMTIFYTCTDR